MKEFHCMEMPEDILEVSNTFSKEKPALRVRMYTRHNYIALSIQDVDALIEHLSELRKEIAEIAMKRLISPE